MSNFILCGMQFGDEGKASFVDYLVRKENADAVVRYNGGIERSHTVVTPEGLRHDFNQLGSGMFKENCHTYLSENMVINLDELLVELNDFSKKTGCSVKSLLERIHINRACYIITPYHVLLDKLQEFASGTIHRGYTGKGVNTVMILKDKVDKVYGCLDIQVRHIIGAKYLDAALDMLKAIQKYVKEFYEKNKVEIWHNISSDVSNKHFKRELDSLFSDDSAEKLLEHYDMEFNQGEYAKYFSNALYTQSRRFIIEHENVVFEGSYGILMDEYHGIYPNNVSLNTSAWYARHYFRNPGTIGVVKPFISRQGSGILTTESSYLSRHLREDKGNIDFWTGRYRVGWFDVILFNYAQKVCKANEIYMSCLDKLSGIGMIKVCSEYVYTGEVDDTFEEIFSYRRTKKGEVRIIAIKENHKELVNYLRKCEPKYSHLKSWKEDISQVTSFDELPENCKNYIRIIEKLIGVPITLISVGPTYKNKIAISSN